MYAPEVKPYLNSNRTLNNLVGGLLRAGYGEENGEPDMKDAERTFLRACAESPNIGNLGGYVSHVLGVSKNSNRIAGEIVKNYPFLDFQLNPAFLGFAGLAHDFIKLVGRYGVGKKGPEEEPDSDSVHEILTYVQMKHMAEETGNGMYDVLADGMGMHGLAPQILEMEHEAGRFQGVQYEDRPRPMLDVVAGVDMLFGEYWLPLATGGDVSAALTARVDDVVARRMKSHGPTHPFIVATEMGGRKRVEGMVERIDGLMKMKYSSQEVADIYSLEI